jgi:LAS superfamily LD-carboxypeptidase LdcB
MKVEPLESMPEGRVAYPEPRAGIYVPEALSLGPSDVPDSLVAIGPPLAVREGLQLRPDALRSLQEMADAALRDGVHLRVTSAYRSWDRQNELYANAVRKHGADQRWVAAPGTSEHQLGTTVDFCDAAMHHVLEPGFADTAEGRWLKENAAHFGWVCSYTAENEALSGYRPEPWHYRFGVAIDREASP